MDNSHVGLKTIVSILVERLGGRVTITDEELAESIGRRKGGRIDGRKELRIVRRGDEMILENSSQ